jgi:NAD(P)H-dependent FMN reductase
MLIADKSPIITIISGSSRDDNNSKKVALEYQRLLRLKEIESALLSLDELDVLHRNADFLEMENRFLIPASKFIIIMPEYNGSYPGILKLIRMLLKHGPIRKYCLPAFQQAGPEI